MSLRGALILLIDSIGCALAVMAPSSSPGLGSIASAAPPYSVAPFILEQFAKSDVAMTTLHQQASFALAQLQTKAQYGR